MDQDIELLREHASTCRLLAQRMTQQHSIQLLSRMADECNDLANGLEADREADGADQGFAIP